MSNFHVPLSSKNIPRGNARIIPSVLSPMPLPLLWLVAPGPLRRQNKLWKTVARVASWWQEGTPVDLQLQVHTQIPLHRRVRKRQAGNWMLRSMGRLGRKRQEERRGVGAESCKQTGGHVSGIASTWLIFPCSSWKPQGETEQLG